MLTAGRQPGGLSAQDTEFRPLLCGVTGIGRKGSVEGGVKCGARKNISVLHRLAGNCRNIAITPIGTLELSMRVRTALTFATVQVSAHLTEPSGSPATVAFVGFELATGKHYPEQPNYLATTWELPRSTLICFLFIGSASGNTLKFRSLCEWPALRLR
jgi:hypothetical protein